MSEQTSDQAGIDAMHHASATLKPLRKKKSARPSKRGKQDTRRHEHSIADNRKQLGSALGVNVGEVAQTGKGITPDAEMTITPETREAVLEIGVDEELEAAQIEM